MSLKGPKMGSVGATDAQTIVLDYFALDIEEEGVEPMTPSSK